MNQESWYQKIVFQKLNIAKIGTLRIHLPNDNHFDFGEQQNSIRSEMRIHDINFFKRLVLHSDIGLGESYTSGEWDSDNITSVIEWFIANFAGQSTTNNGLLQTLLNKLATIPNQLLHYARSNSIRQSKKNIQAHYDIGNSFYQEWLDETMTYSSAFFTSTDQSLKSAQEEKYQRLITKLGIQEHHKVLEIGCGWGGFAHYLAKNVGCRIHCITLSEEQKSYVEDLIQKDSLEEYIEVQLIDYRKITGKYDRIVSIEMLEAVGHKYLPHFFRKCNELLKLDGILGFQAILCADHRYSEYRIGADWIKKYIFPGGHLPSSHAILETTSKYTDLQLQNYESFGIHYAKTLQIWASNVKSKKPKLASLGFDEHFFRTWLFYLYYCEAAFRQRHIQVAHFIMTHSNSDAYHWDSKCPSMKINQSKTTITDPIV